MFPKKTKFEDFEEQQEFDKEFFNRTWIFKTENVDGKCQIVDEEQKKYDLLCIDATYSRIRGVLLRSDKTENWRIL